MENQGPIALESCLGSNSVGRPLASGGLDPSQPDEYDDFRPNKNSNRKRRPQEFDAVKRFKFIDDDGTSRIIFCSSHQHESVITPFEDFRHLNIPDECYKLAEHRYLFRGARARYTDVIGSKGCTIQERRPKSDFTRIPVLHRSKRENCLPFAIFNLLQVPLHETTKANFLKELGCSHCGLPEFTVVVKRFGIHLFKVKNNQESRSIDWLLSRESGLYLIITDVHCISVDVDRKLIFDCGYAFALNLHKESLIYCGFSTIDNIRSISLPKYLLPSKR
jgi:hypothetical protein